MKILCDIMTQMSGGLRHQIALAIMDKNDPGAVVFRERFGDGMYFCGEQDLRPVTREQACMNRFDLIFVPRMLYLLDERNIETFMKILVWSMSPRSTLVFATPNKNAITGGEALLPNEVVAKVKAKSDAYSAKRKGKWFGGRERWNRVVVDDWRGLFLKWNLIHPRAKFVPEEAEVSDLNSLNIVRIDLTKTFA